MIILTKNNPFTKEQITNIAINYPTPFHIYDEKAIRDNAKKLNNAFSWSKNFKNFFAVKATPNPYILEILKEEGMGVDCSSYPELILAEKVGFKGEEIMFTSNNTPANEFKKAMELGAVINLDDITHINYLEEYAGIPDLICFRYNPGASREGNDIIGKPQEAKYGLTKEQLLEAYSIMKTKGVKRFGLHTMVASNELNTDYFLETAKMLFELVKEIQEKLDITIEFINLGGGIGIPYKPEEKPIDLDELSKKMKELYYFKSLRIVMECGRMVTGPYGYLVSKVRHVTSKYKEYVGLDSCMADLMRPGMYGAYHHVSVIGKEGSDHTYDVTGSLCENNDKFAIDRKLPKIEVGDFIVIHDAGAHGHAMGFQYNGKLRPAELLLKPDGSVKLIRRAETTDDYFQTLEFDGADYDFTNH